MSEPIDISLTDCSSCTYANHKAGALVALAVSRLQEKFSSGEIECLSLTGREISRDIDPPIKSNIRAFGAVNSCSTVDEILLSASCLIGQVQFSDSEFIIGKKSYRILFDIRPRFGNGVFHYLLASACGVYLPRNLQGKNNGQNNEREEPNWLLYLMWFSAFQRAYRRCSIPKAYIPISKNLRFFRGRLNVIQQIRSNLVDQSKFYCDYKPLSMNVTINRTIRYVYKLISNSKIGRDRRFFQFLAEHDDRLASFGVENTPVTPEKIDEITYTRMSEPYRPLMQLSKAVILLHGTHDFKQTSTPAFFVDVSEIWENYLLKLCQKKLPEFTFVSPNEKPDHEWLFKDGLRSIRPDFLVYKNGKLIAVMDAKYKNNYKEIGQYEIVPGAVGREDLYQMATYLYHYGEGKPLLGIFLSPNERSNEDAVPYPLASNPKHAMALCNLELPSDTDVTEKDEDKRNAALTKMLHEREDAFIDRLKVLLNRVEAESLDLMAR